MPFSFWNARTHSLDLDQHFDVAILGGGFVGLSVAYWLKQLKPETKIIVIDREGCGSGASGKNAGFLTKGSASFYKGLCAKFGEDRALLVKDFAQESLKLTFEHLLKGSSTQEASSLTLFQTESEHALWKKDFSPETFGFVPVRNNDLGDFLKSRFEVGYRSAGEYKLNPLDLIDVLKRKLHVAGVVMAENTTGFKLLQDGVALDQKVIKAQQVILALNGYSSQFHRAFASHIAPKRAQMLAVKLSKPLDCPGLHYDPLERVYWRLVGNDTLLIGGKRLLDEASEVGEFEKVSPLIQDGLEQYLAQKLQITYSPIRRWSGIMGFTEDELPIVTEINAPLKAFVVAGFSGHGIGLGFHAGLECARMSTGEISSGLFASLRKKKIEL